MVFDRYQVDAVLTRALEIDAGSDEDTLGVAALARLADELGVSPGAFSQAIAEIAAPSQGPLNAIAQATIPAPVPEVERALGCFLRLRGLQLMGSSVWQQQSGWWPDLYRFRAVTPVAVALAPSDGGSVVRLTARLDRVWRVHLLGAMLAPVLVALSLVVTSSAAGAVGGLLVAGAWAGVCAWAYQHRREAIRRRLARALADVAEPAYRLQPW